MTNFRRGVLAVAAAGTLAAGLAACGGGSGSSSSGSKVSGGTLYYSYFQPTNAWDPQRTYVGVDISNETRLFYRQLVAYPASTDAKTANTPVPDLATTTGTSTQGGKVWSFTLKNGVKWQDGKAITCADLAYGASRNFATDVITGGPSFYLLSYLDVPADKKTGLPRYDGPYKGDYQSDFNKAVVCKGNTITYHFNKPWPDFPLAIASLHMMDPYRKDKDQGDKSNFAIFSDGPYELQGTWNKNSGGTAVRNPNYDKTTDSTALRKALPGKYVFSIGSAVETIYDQLFADSGNAKNTISSNRIPTSDYSQIDANKSRYLNVESPYVDYLAPNFKRLTNPLVRRALAVSTNAQGWINAGGGSKAYSTADSIVNPSVSGYKANSYFSDLNKSGDPTAAKKLLQQAGVSTPYPINFAYQEVGADTDKQAAALQATWNKSGFKVTLDPISSDTYYDQIRKPSNTYDVMWAGWGADWPSAQTVTPPLFDGRQLTSTSSQSNYGMYNSKAFDNLVDQAAKSSTLTQQTSILQQADTLLGKDTAYIPLEIAKFNWLWGSNVTGYATTTASNSFPDLGLIGVKS